MKTMTVFVTLLALVALASGANHRHAEPSNLDPASSTLRERPLHRQ